MFIFAKRVGVVALTVAILLVAVATPVRAQRRSLPVHSYYPYNTNAYTFPGLPANVYNPSLNNIHRPNPNPIIANGGGYYLGGLGYGGIGYGGYYGSPFGLNLNLSNPGYGRNNVAGYTFSLGGGYYPGYVNPFASSYSNTYDSTYNYPATYSGGGGYAPVAYPSVYGGNYISPYSGYLFGTADVMRAYGQLATTSEQARILREVATQAQLETKKKELDTMNYLQANTPTYAAVVKKNARNELDRIQNVATPGEIWSGKALNVLLADIVQKTLTKSLKLHPLPLNEKLMAHINVTAKDGFGNIGLLRNDGRFDWPVALRELATEKEQKEIADDAREAYRRSATGLKFADYVNQLSSRIEDLRERLLKRANDMPTDQYLTAKRFLNNFDDAIAAIKIDDVRRNQEFHKEFSGEGKTVQDLVDYMAKNGLRFAPAITGDEDAYQALYSMMAAYSLAAGSTSSANAAVPHGNNNNKDF